MSLYTMVFLIVTVVITGDIIKRVTSNTSRKDVDNARIRDLEESLAKIERRLSNVETIVTSKDYDLKQEFEGLKS